MSARTSDYALGTDHTTLPDFMLANAVVGVVVIVGKQNHVVNLRGSIIVSTERSVKENFNSL